MKASELDSSEYPAYYSNYINQSGELDLIEGLQQSMDDIIQFWASIPDDKLEFQYEEGKWTVKEIIQHLIDTERVFAYRAMRFSRNDTTELPGFDENEYVAPSKSNRRSLEELLVDYHSLRLSTIALFKSFDDSMLLSLGTASGGSMSVRAAGFVIIGHETHHCKVIQGRYL